MEKLIIKETDLKMDIYFSHILLKFNKIKLSAKNYIQKNAEKTFSIIAILSILICFSLIIYEHRNYFFSIIGVLTIITTLIAISICIYLKSFKSFSAIYKRNIHLFRDNVENDLISLDIDLDKNSEIESPEEKFKLFFNEDKYEEFKNIAIDLDIINKKMKWTYKRKELLYFVLLFYKLEEKQYLKKPINREKFCEASKDYLEIKIDKSLFSKYNPKKDILLHEHIECYNNEYSVFI
jgi:hypothetical protein